MPLFDARAKEILVRIVYDGPPDAGKTTNLQFLHQVVPRTIRTELETPGPQADQTLYFDCFDIRGIRCLGYRIRCQLLSVPGQSYLINRRRYLLSLADAVVFVADSSRSELELNRQLFHDLEQSLDAEYGDPTSVQVLLQANKQDLEDRFSVEEILNLLNLSPTFPHTIAQANIGQGVKKTFMVALQLALGRLKALRERKRFSLSSGSQLSVDTLFQALETLETEEDFGQTLQEMTSANEVEVSNSSGTLQEEQESSEAVMIATETPPQGGYQDTGAEPPEDPEENVPILEIVTDEPYEENGQGEDSIVEIQTHDGAVVEEEDVPVLEVAEEYEEEAEIGSITIYPSELPQIAVRAGHIWPPATGREYLRQLVEYRDTFPGESWETLPSGSQLLHLGTQWHLLTQPEWRFTDSNQGRSVLMKVVSDQMTMKRFLPEGKTVLLTEEGENWRLWICTPHVPTLWEQFEGIVAQQSPGDFSIALRKAERSLQTIRSQALALSVGIDLSLSVVAETPLGVVYLGEIISGGETLADDKALKHAIAEELRPLLYNHPGLIQSLEMWLNG
ncbi:Hypothetical protein PBC10988_26550 [Planctomycetales bacterium 10988]|nr:Hypothetical protein PBC10988_26550 [Planctomycetales bacterium 10988]